MNMRKPLILALALACTAPLACVGSGDRPVRQSDDIPCNTGERRVCRNDSASRIETDEAEQSEICRCQRLDRPLEIP